jgi:hypothetical protein
MTTEPIVSTEVILNAFTEGKENADFHLACADNLTTSSQNTLTLLAAGGYGALGYAAHLFEGGAGNFAIACGVSAGAVHLLVVAALIVAKCLRARDYNATHNEAQHLLGDGQAWAQIVRGEIENLAERIAENRAANAAIGRWLNRLWLAALFVPITFLVGWAVAAWVAAQVPGAMG